MANTHAHTPLFPSMTGQGRAKCVYKPGVLKKRYDVVIRGQRSHTPSHASTHTVKCIFEYRPKNNRPKMERNVVVCVEECAMI